MCGCHSMHVEVRGQLLGVGSPSYHVGPADRIQSSGLCGKRLYPRRQRDTLNFIFERWYFRPLVHFFSFGSFKDAKKGTQE